MRPCPPDALPILGRVPGVDGAYMAGRGKRVGGVYTLSRCVRRIATSQTICRRDADDAQTRC